MRVPFRPRLLEALHAEKSKALRFWRKFNLRSQGSFENYFALF